MICTWTIGKDCTLLNLVTYVYKWSLVHTGILVCDLVLSKFIDIEFIWNRWLIWLYLNGNAGNINDFTVSSCLYHDAGIVGCSLFHTCTDSRSLREYKRNCLALHVRTHEGSVGVVVFKERNKGCCNRYNLLRGYIHPVDLTWRSCGVILHSSDRYIAFKDKFTLCILLDISVTLGDSCLLFIVYIKILAIVCNHTIEDFSIWSLDKTELIDLCIVCKSKDKTDVSTFRCFNRTDLSIVGVVYVSDVEELSCVISLDTTLWTDGTDSSLVSKLCKRVYLIHEL